MIKHVRGNLLQAEVEALVNPVNCIGVMGKGLALQFKESYPDNFYAYVRQCRTNRMRLGKVFVFINPVNKKQPLYIINFPTKRHWKDRSKLYDIQSGLADLVQVVKDYQIHSIAIPALGCGLGGLDLTEVEPLIRAAFIKLPEVNALLYLPES